MVLLLAAGKRDQNAYAHQMNGGHSKFSKPQEPAIRKVSIFSAISQRNQLPRPKQTPDSHCRFDLKLDV